MKRTNNTATTQQGGAPWTRLAAGMVTASALVLTACSADDSLPRVDGTEPTTTDAAGEDGETSPGPVDETTPRTEDAPSRRAKVALGRFDGCDAFLEYVHNEGADRVGAYGFDNQRYWRGDDVLIMEATEVPIGALDESEPNFDTATEDSADPAAPGGAPAPTPQGDDGSGTFSETNVQVEGVDEPDIVKTDGQRVLAITGNQLVYVDIADGGRAGERRGSVTLTEEQSGAYVYGQELLMSGDRAFVIANIDGGAVALPKPVVDDGDAEADFVDDLPPIEPIPTDFYPRPHTAVFEVDLSDPDDLRIANSLTVEGRYVSARSIGDTARLVVSTSPDDLGFLYPSGPDSEERAIEANRELIRETSIEHWVPTYTLTDDDGGTDTGSLVGCDGIHAPAEFAGFDMLSVLTLPMDTSLDSPAATTSIMATGDTVYSSEDRMYVATNEWITPTFDERERGDWEDTFQTGIHRFSLPAGEPARYEASGSVEGHLLNQFSMHDQDGTFFVATTTGTPWSGDRSESQIVSMQADGDRLEQIGLVGGIGKGEQIFSVRYVADTAYVVTFRQTDPFYVVDLSAPTDMVVRGELKIPGVSTYLHPISDTLVLGVGQEGTDDGRLTGSKVSLFDVSDPSDPREVDVWTLQASNSDAEFDHRAFLWWEPTSTAVLPLVSWNDSFAGAVVLNVTEDGIAEQGRVTHADPDEGDARTDCRELTAQDVPDESFGELFWYVREPGASIGLCGSGDEGSAQGGCEVVPATEFEDWFWLGDAGEFPVDLDGVDRIELCWSDGFEGYDQRIVRTMVIGDQLWTLAPTTLQANDLETLDRTTTVSL